MAALVKTQAVLRVGRQHVAPALAAACVQFRESSELASMKRGSGGRASFSGNVVTVLGASGFLGRYVVNQLGKIGSQVICPYRGEPYYMKDLKLAGDLGQILFLPYSIRDEASLVKVMKYSNVVINLVGRDTKTRNFSFNDVHVTGARSIARAARLAGVKKLIHFSSLNASETPQTIFMKDGSEFLKSKFAGEVAVREEFPEATIMRPADIFGPEDRFLRYYASHWRRQMSLLPLWRLGADTIKMPVFCSDVAQGVLAVIRDTEAAGKTFECVGPHSYYLYELVDFFFRCMRFSNYHRVPINPIFKVEVMWMSMMPSYPILNFEKLEREHITDVRTGCPTLADLGVQLMRIEDRAPWELKPFRRHRYYEESIGEFADPEPPKIYA